MLRVEDGRVYVRDPNASAGSRFEGMASAVPEARQGGTDVRALFGTSTLTLSLSQRERGC